MIISIAFSGYAAQAGWIVNPTTSIKAVITHKKCLFPICASFHIFRVIILISSGIVKKFVWDFVRREDRHEPSPPDLISKAIQFSKRGKPKADNKPVHRPASKRQA